VLVLVVYSLANLFFVTFSAKSFVSSIIIATFVVSFPYWKLQMGLGGVDIYT